MRFRLNLAISSPPMRATELEGKNIVIWGTGVEARAAADFIRTHLPDEPITFVDESTKTPEKSFGLHDTFVSGEDAVAAALLCADVIVKSPGVSLYHPLLTAVRESGTPITSLLNFWFAEPHTAKTILVTGSKGKSTVSALLGYVLNELGHSTAVVGNIGVPITSVPETGTEFVVIETSSYQTADFDGTADIGVVVSLFPEHLDWHRSLPAYYRDKLNVLLHAREKIVSTQAAETMKESGIEIPVALLANDPDGIHADNAFICDGATEIGIIPNAYLSRRHNAENVCVVLTIVRTLGFNISAALSAMETFSGLPHREQELGTKNGVLYVDDSISTTPQSAIAALRVYSDRPTTLIAGGFDRGVDYAPLADYIQENKINAVVCLGESGARIQKLLEGDSTPVHTAHDMTEAVAFAREHTPLHGVILLSPAAPSFGLFKDYIERGTAFAHAAGF